MKNKLLIGIACMVSILTFLLYLYNINLIKYEKSQELILVSKDKNTSRNEEHKIYSYYDLLKILKKANNNFIINKINKNDSKYNVINFKVSFSGNVNEFFESVNYIQNQGIICDIDKIDISKGRNYNNIIEMDINLYKYK